MSGDRKGGDDSKCRLNVESESQAGPGMDTSQ